jgi:hypothetical protein
LKKTAAILLLALFTFNWFGYQLFSIYLQNRVTSQLDRKLDTDEYEEQDLVAITIPVSVPYQNSRPDFERCYGEIEISGKHYTYVKRRFINDSLILLCLPNTEKNNIVKAKNSFYKLVNGLHSASSEKSTGKTGLAFYKSILAEFLSPESKWPATYSVSPTATAYPEWIIPVYLSYKRHLPEIPPEGTDASTSC